MKTPTASRVRPVTAADYAEREYGLTKEEMDRAAEWLGRDARSALAAGNVVAFGTLEKRLDARRKAKRRGAARKTA